MEEVAAMTKLDRLVAVLCPDGVLYKSLNECCKLSAGGDASKERYLKEQTNEYSIPINKQMYPH